MITIRLQEFLEAKNVTIEQLSQMADVPEELIRSYANNFTSLTETTANHLRAISDALEICVTELFAPISEQEPPIEDLTAIDWGKARSLEPSDIELLANKPMTGISTIFCDLFPNAPRCRP